MTLAGKAAIVTGAGSGFGEGIARLFAAEGAKVLVADLVGQQAHRVTGAIRDAGGEARACVGDVSQRADFQRMVDETLAAFGRLDVVVNNAGTTHRNTPMLEVDEATYDRVFAVNVKSIYWSAICAVPVLRRQGGGSIINIASTAGLRPRPGPHLVQRQQGCGGDHLQVDGGRAGARQHPGQRDLPGDRRDRPDLDLHGRRHAGAAREVRRLDPARPDEPARGHRRRGAVSGVRSGRLPDRHGARGRRRPLHLRETGMSDPTMRAVVLDGFGGPEVMRLDEVPRPRPGPGQVLIRVAATSVNRADLQQRSGNYAPPPGESEILGLEVAGVIAQLGGGVTGWQVGDRVMTLVGGGGYAEYATAPASTLMPVPGRASIWCAPPASPRCSSRRT